MNISAILGIIDKLMTVYERFRRRKKNDKRQEKADEIANNPGDAFAEHFGGVRVDPKSNASETSKTED